MITAIIISAVAGIAVGAIGMNVLGNDVSSQSASVDINTDAPELAEEVGDAANAVTLAELGVSKALAEAPAASIACRAAVEEDAQPREVALCALLACWSHVEGAETSAGLGCLDRGKVLDGMLETVAEPAE